MSDTKERRLLSPAFAQIIGIIASFKDVPSIPPELTMIFEVPIMIGTATGNLLLRLAGADRPLAGNGRYKCFLAVQSFIAF